MLRKHLISIKKDIKMIGIIIDVVKKNCKKKIFNFFGFEVHKLKSDELMKIITGNEKLKFNIIFDIGANTGQFSLDVRRKGYKGKIVSFEPLTIARKKLLYNSSKDPNWFVHEQTAIGDFKGTININISKNSVSSSILPMHNLHSDAEIDSVYVNQEKNTYYHS